MKHMRMCTHTQTHRHTHTRTHARTHTQTQKHIHTHTHTHKHTQKHTHTQHTQKHTHTHTQVLTSGFSHTNGSWCMVCMLNVTLVPNIIISLILQSTVDQFKYEPLGILSPSTKKSSDNSFPIYGAGEYILSDSLIHIVVYESLDRSSLTVQSIWLWYTVMHLATMWYHHSLSQPKYL